MYINPKQGLGSSDGMEKLQVLIRLGRTPELPYLCLLYTSDAADDWLVV